MQRCKSWPNTTLGKQLYQRMCTTATASGPGGDRNPPFRRLNTPVGTNQAISLQFSTIVDTLLFLRTIRINTTSDMINKEAPPFTESTRNWTAGSAYSAAPGSLPCSIRPNLMGLDHLRSCLNHCQSTVWPSYRYLHKPRLLLPSIWTLLTNWDIARPCDTFGQWQREKRKNKLFF